MPDDSISGGPRPCPPPDPNPRGPSRLKVPAGAVDTHAHVIGLPPRYPFVASRSFTPLEAPLEKYLAMLGATGMTFGALTQVSVHGTDNRLLIEALEAEPKRLRGVAVTPADAPERELTALKDAGVVAVRLNVLYGGGMASMTLSAMARFAATWGGTCSFSSMRASCPSLPQSSRNCPWNSSSIIWAICQLPKV
jgi:2-pyrone-4,6-dicarboxylate lactonase